jgi:penicillin V acylase-like amidase (Ntn superfamily)
MQMKCFTARLIAILALTLSSRQSAWPCSTFCLSNAGRPVVGQNYDWGVEDGFAIVNQRDVSKVAAVMDVPATWKVRYGSVTLNQYGREFPTGGMNEAGLVVATMWLDASEHPATDSRPAVTSLQWIQYQLDNAATVEEVIASDERIRISRAHAVPLHYFVADANGSCAVIEFIDGKAVCHSGPGLPVCALTNSRYEESLAHLGRCAGFGGSAAVAPDSSSLGRFAWAAIRLRLFEPREPGAAVANAFETLAEVAQRSEGLTTRWSIVYDIAARRINFRTHARAEIRTIELDKLDYTCGGPTQALNLAAPVSGDATDAFAEYTKEMNRRLIGDAYSQTSFLRDVPPVLLDVLANYPETLTCDEGGRQTAASACRAANAFISGTCAGPWRSWTP